MQIRPSILTIALVLGTSFLTWQSMVHDADAQISSRPPLARDKGMVDIDRFPEWLEEFRRTAIESGIDPDVAARALSSVSFNHDVIELQSYQPEYVRPIWEFLEHAASSYRITVGLRKLREQRELLQSLEARFGVPMEIITAIWGLETGYGTNLGSFNVIESLATIAFGGRRTAFARKQLLAALKILDEAGANATTLRGSWAGALGHTQFIPTTFLVYAIDYNGDGYRDVWSRDPSDALGSAASYLAESGWRRDVPVVLEVRLPADFDYRNAELSRTRPYGQWLTTRLTLATGEPLPDDLPRDAEASVITPTGYRGPAFLAFENFRALLLYNNAASYVLGVWLLAEQLARRQDLVVEWPESDGVIRVGEISELQKLLTALGHDTEGVDGMVGPRTRAAVRSFQLSLRQVPDGHINPALIEAARRKVAERQ